MDKFAHYERKLTDTLCKAPAREKGLLVANNRAHRSVYGTELLARTAVFDIRDSVDASDARRYNGVLSIEETVFDYLAGVQLCYLTLRERLATVAELFSLFAQDAHFADLLNWISCGKSTTHKKLRTEIMSHTVWFGALNLSDEDGDEWINIHPSDQMWEAALDRIHAAHAQATELKTKIAVVRNFMAEKDARLKAYEEYLTGIEGELSEVIRSVKGRVYRLDGEGGKELRDFLAETCDELYVLMESLPDYEALAIDEAVYTTEYAELASR
ncbi:MAG: hypothetical protein ACXV3U_04450 [Halobacteriota archaeon]